LYVFFFKWMTIVRGFIFLTRQKMKKSTTIQVQWVPINVIQNEFISLTDIARRKDPERSDYVIQNRMRRYNTIEFLWLWEQINNPYFKPIEFDGFKNQAGSNSFSLTPKRWIENTNAVWIITKKWKYWGWTYAHKDIAIKFANRISVEFELYLIKEFQRLKEHEDKALDRDVKRFLTKMNYRIHTDAIKEHLVPKKLTKDEINYIYADEADVLNISLFWITSKQRKERYPEQIGNMRDYANIEQLIILANLESINAQFIKMGMLQSERLQLLNQTAITQMRSLISHRPMDVLP